MDSTFGADLESHYVEERDPSLNEGHTVLYDREVPFELRSEEAVGGGGTGEMVGCMEAIKVKILLLGDAQTVSQIRVELSSENDLFFHFTHNMNPELYRVVQEQQKLVINFAEYPNVLIKMLNSCIRDSSSHLGVLIMQSGGTARMDFIQNMEYKFIELLSLEYGPSTEEMVRQQITYRYLMLKSRMGVLQERLKDVNALVKIKNPSLLLQLQVQQSPGGRRLATK